MCVWFTQMNQIRAIQMSLLLIFYLPARQFILRQLAQYD